jgi:hypothetical protein
MKTYFACAYWMQCGDRHLTIPPKLGGIARGACSQEKSWFAR